MAFAKINGIDLYYEIHGEGRTLVLSHGIGSNHLHWWQQVPALSKHAQVIIFDHRGFGFSKDTNGLGPKAFVDDLEALLSHLGVQKAVLCGQSMGGVTIGGYASKHPERVSGLILSCSGGGFFPVPHSETFKEAVMKVRNYAEFSKVSIEQDGFPQREPTLRFLFESLAQLNHHFDISRLRDMVSLKFDLKPIVESHMPVLLLGAEDDNGANAALKQIQAAVPRSQLHIVPKAGHLLFFENARAYNSLVSEFLAAIKPD